MGNTGIKKISLKKFFQLIFNFLASGDIEEIESEDCQKIFSFPEAIISFHFLILLFKQMKIIRESIIGIIFCKNTLLVL